VVVFRIPTPTTRWSRIVFAIVLSTLRGPKLVHAIADNYATHKHPKVIEWLADHQRWIFHFTPTSASTQKQGAFHDRD
jgi:hypothetical protein